MPWDEVVSRVQFAEELGFDGAWGFDHFQPMYGDGPGETFEGMTTLAALAGVDLADPARPARGGRDLPAPVGVRRAGDDDRPRVARPARALARRGVVRQGAHTSSASRSRRRRQRFDLLEDALEIVQRLFTGDVVSYEGRVVSLHDAQLRPPPGAAAPPADLDRGQRSSAHAAARRAVRRRLARVGHAELVARDQRPRRRARRRGRAATRRRSCGPARCRSTTSRRRASTRRSGATRVRLPRVRLARRRPPPGRGLRPRRDARVHRLSGLAVDGQSPRSLRFSIE